MALAQALPRPSTAPTGSAAELVAILARPLPALPPGGVSAAAAELRHMHSRRAASVWRHPGWTDLVGWIIRAVPDCDPTVAAVHAVSNRERALVDPGYARSLAAYVRRIAQRSAVEAHRHTPGTVELIWDPPEPSFEGARPTDSLAAEASRLLFEAGARPSRESWSLIATGVDIAVDWWVGLAERTGLVGDELVVASRQSWRTTGNHRLRTNFDGPTARPLVSLLVGGDQRGRAAREAAGVEAGLLYWSLLVRHSGGEEPAPVPPMPIRRAWRTHVEGIEQAISSAGSAITPAIGPTIAA